MSPILLQRFSYMIRKFPVIPKLITLFIRVMYNCYLPSNLKLGRNFVLGYGGLGVVIHDRTKIGEDCHISQNVTIGGTSKKHGVPKLVIISTLVLGLKYCGQSQLEIML